MQIYIIGYKRNMKKDEEKKKKNVQIVKLCHISELWWNRPSQLVAMQIPTFEIWNEKNEAYKAKILGNITVVSIIRYFRYINTFKSKKIIS